MIKVVEMVWFVRIVEIVWIVWIVEIVEMVPMECASLSLRVLLNPLRSSLREFNGINLD